MADLSLQGSAQPAARGNFLNQYLAVGWGVVALVFGGLIAWSVFAPFEGAVLTAGQITVASNQQAVQHLEGGIVREIYVREADAVTEGQKLLSLDATATGASLQALEARLFGLLGTEARLIAERDGTSELTLRPGFESLTSRPDIQAVLASQKSLMAARNNNLGTQGTILRQRIDHRLCLRQPGTGAGVPRCGRGRRRQVDRRPAGPAHRRDGHAEPRLCARSRWPQAVHAAPRVICLRVH